jgi:hypothetical protein
MFYAVVVKVYRCFLGITSATNLHDLPLTKDLMVHTHTGFDFPNVGYVLRFGLIVVQRVRKKFLLPCLLSSHSLMRSVPSWAERCLNRSPE